MSGLPKRSWPRGDIRRVYLHWTAGDYTTIFPAYHVCVALDERGDPTAYATSDVRANMRDVRATDRPYAAHTSGRNSYALGIAICGMADAAPHDFGAFPLRDDMVSIACETTASACAAYGIPIDAAHVCTHAEAALEDGYFGSDPEERWDIARLVAAPAALDGTEAARVGDALRERISVALAATAIADPRARLASLALYVLLVAAVIFWALLIWHPWIDWFGRPR